MSQYHSCTRKGCPCLSYDGQAGHYCCKTCKGTLTKQGIPCAQAFHTTPVETNNSSCWPSQPKVSTTNNQPTAKICKNPKCPSEGIALSIAGYHSINCFKN